MIMGFDYGIELDNWRMYASWYLKATKSNTKWSAALFNFNVRDVRDDGILS